MRALAFLLLFSCAGLQRVPNNAKVPEMVARTLKLTVSCKDPTRDTGGSAVRLGHHMVLTARHITEGHADCQYTGETADGSNVDLVFVKQSSRSDVAVLSEREELESVKMVVAKLGETVWAVGFPSVPGTTDQHLSVTSGTVAEGPDDDGDTRITNSIWYGSSGGGAWNEAGYLVGITVSFRPAAGYSYMVGVDALRQFLANDLEEE